MHRSCQEGCHIYYCDGLMHTLSFQSSLYNAYIKSNTLIILMDTNNTFCILPNDS